MNGMRSFLRNLLALVVVVALSGGVASVSAASAVERAARCKPTGAVVTMNTPAAVRLLKSLGCTNVIVRNICMDRSFFGKVVYAWPVSGEYPAKRRVTLWRGIEGTGTDCMLEETFPGQFDGYYQFERATGTMSCTVGATTTTESLSMFPEGGVFGVEDGQLTGGVLQGIVRSDGRAQALIITGNPRFPSLSGELQFQLDLTGRLTAYGVFNGGFTQNSGVECTTVQELRASFVPE